MLTNTELYYKSIGSIPKGTKFCLNCKKEFNIYITRDLIRKKFCSHACKASYNYSPKTKEKSSKTLSEKMKLGLVPKPPRQTRESIYKASLKRRGELNWKWIKDRTKLRLRRFNNSERRGSIAAWRTDVFMRDNYTCQDCGEIGGKLNAHHIYEWADFPEFRYDLENGITLCNKCHKLEHKRRKENAYSSST